MNTVNPAVKIAITNHLSKTLKNLQIPYNIDVVYGDDVEWASKPLDIVLSSLISMDDIVTSTKQYKAFHEKLHEEVSVIMPSYSPCWYVHEVIRIIALDGKKIPALLIETLSCPAGNIHEVKAHNLLED